MKNSLLKIYLLLFLMAGDFYLFAQPGSDNPGGDLEGDDDPPASINAKLVYLAILGIAFAFYFIMKKREQKAG
ncbi:hypothetical protein [Flavobacterium cyanobacteriorum]|uniref:hypothetical protein n=1 Tax=Flavobacterium cyanobacteriorum TaxID=2022802 RepID=UPI00101AD687|nr:hypothetical protein [Flavobacterium cyanobacteriorum]